MAASSPSPSNRSHDEHARTAAPGAKRDARNSLEFEYAAGGHATFQDGARQISIALGATDRLHVDLNTGTVYAAEYARVAGLHRLAQEIVGGAAQGAGDRLRDGRHWRAGQTTAVSPGGPSAQPAANEDDAPDTGEDTEQDNDSAGPGNEPGPVTPPPSSSPSEAVPADEEEDWEAENVADSRRQTGGALRQIEVAGEEDEDDMVGAAATPTVLSEEDQIAEIEAQGGSISDDPFLTITTRTSAEEPHEFGDGGPLPPGFTWGGNVGTRRTQAIAVRMWRRAQTPTTARAPESSVLASSTVRRPENLFGAVESEPAGPRPRERAQNDITTRRSKRRPPKRYTGQMALWSGFGLMPRAEIVARPDVQDAVLTLQRYDLYNPCEIVLQVGPEKAKEAVAWYHRKGGERVFYDAAAAIANYCLRSRHRAEHVREAEPENVEEEEAPVVPHLIGAGR